MQLQNNPFTWITLCLIIFKVEKMFAVDCNKAVNHERFCADAVTVGITVDCWGHFGHGGNSNL